MKSKELSKAAHIDALTNTITKFPCSYCERRKEDQEECQECSATCRTVCRLEAEVIYHEHIAPLQHSLFLRRLALWILVILCLFLLLFGQNKQPHHHILEQAADIFVDTISFKPFHIQLRP